MNTVHLTLTELMSSTIINRYVKDLNVPTRHLIHCTHRDPMLRVKPAPTGTACTLRCHTVPGLTRTR